MTIMISPIFSELLASSLSFSAVSNTLCLILSIPSMDLVTASTPVEATSVVFDAVALIFWVFSARS